MSLSGATRALGSSIIEGSYSKLDGLRPAVTCLPARGRRAKAAPRLPRPANAHCWGRRARPEGHDRMASPMGSKRWKIVVYEPLTQDFALRSRRQLVPVRPIFFLIYQFNFRPLGIIFWVGDHSLSSGLESAGVDAVVALGRVARTPVPAGRLRPE